MFHVGLDSLVFSSRGDHIPAPRPEFDLDNDSPGSDAESGHVFEESDVEGAEDHSDTHAEEREPKLPQCDVDTVSVSSQRLIAIFGSTFNITTVQLQGYPQRQHELRLKTSSGTNWILIPWLWRRFRLCLIPVLNMTMNPSRLVAFQQGLVSLRWWWTSLNPYGTNVTMIPTLQSGPFP